MAEVLPVPPALDGSRLAARRRRDNWITLLLLAPGVGFLALFLVIPLAQVFLRSVGLAAVGQASRFTWEYYRNFGPRRSTATASSSASGSASRPR